jgi:hypothetical protein
MVYPHPLAVECFCAVTYPYRVTLSAPTRLLTSVPCPGKQRLDRQGSLGEASLRGQVESHEKARVARGYSYAFGGRKQGLYVADIQAEANCTPLRIVQLPRRWLWELILREFVILTHLIIYDFIY